MFSLLEFRIGCIHLNFCIMSFHFRLNPGLTPLTIDATLSFSYKHCFVDGRAYLPWMLQFRIPLYSSAHAARLSLKLGNPSQSHHEFAFELHVSYSLLFWILPTGLPPLHDAHNDITESIIKLFSDSLKWKILLSDLVPFTLVKWT